MPKFQNAIQLSSVAYVVIMRTLYVMKTSMRKNDRNTVAPYNVARSVRAGIGTLYLTTPALSQYP